MAPFSVFLQILILSPVCLSYVELGQPVGSKYYIPQVPTPRPHQLPPDEDMRYEMLPSMITAIAPSTTVADNGTYATMYSMHYHSYFVRRNVGKGVFKRGVFASDPPIATCTPCGGDATSVTPNLTVATSTASCTLHTYLGVFRSSVGTAATPAASYCYDSTYSGVFVKSTVSTSGLPCCFTIPPQCRANYTSTSMSYTYTSGVFRPTSTASSSTRRSSTTASPSSSRRLTTASATSSGSSSISTSSGSSSTTTGSRSGSLVLSTHSGTSSDPFLTTVSGSISGSGVTSASTTLSTSAFVSASTSLSLSGSSSSSLSASQYVETSGAASVSGLSFASTITSVTVVSSTTVFIIQSASASRGPAQGPRPGDPSPITLSVVTAAPSSRSLISIITTVPNTVEGCGTASGSGIVVGSGTVYIGPGAFIPVISSGTVSGSAARVVGCGTLIATSGSFSGSATIIGCGSGSGTATMTGSGTVWPAALGGFVPFISSGTVTGSGRVEGCGTLVGSGTFSATSGYVTNIYPTQTPVQTTVEVYVSSCPALNDMGLPRLGDNSTSPTTPGPDTFSALNTTSPVNATELDSSLDNPLCHICANDAGICCPLRTTCQADGHCPWDALQAAGYVLVGLNVVADKNSSISVPAPANEKVRLARSANLVTFDDHAWLAEFW